MYWPTHLLICLSVSVSVCPPSFPSLLKSWFPTIPLYHCLNVLGLVMFRGGEDLLAESWQLPELLQPAFLPFFSFLLFTFDLSNSVGISLWTVKIHYLPRASRRAKSEVTNRSEVMFLSVFLFLRAKGQCGHPLNIHCASNLWSSLLTGGRGDTIIQNKVPSLPDLIWQRMTVKSHEFNPIRKEASLD